MIVFEDGKRLVDKAFQRVVRCVWERRSKRHQRVRSERTGAMQLCASVIYMGNEAGGWRVENHSLSSIREG